MSSGVTGVMGKKLRRDIRARWLQFGAVAITVFLGITLFGAAYGSYRNLQASYAEVYETLRLADYTIQGGEAATIEKDARALDDVKNVSTRLVADLPVEVGKDHKFYGRIVGLPDGGKPPANRVQILKGKPLHAGKPDDVLVDQHMADHFDLGPGDSVRAFLGDSWRSLKIIGVAASPEYIWPARSRDDEVPSQDDFGVLYALDGLLQPLPEPARATDVLVLYRSGADRRALDEKLSKIAHEKNAVDAYSRADQPSNAVLNEDLDSFGTLSYLFPILFLAAAGMAAYVLLTRMVSAQMPVIGVLLANGMTRRRVAIHYVSFGLAAALVGAIPGLVVGPLVARSMTGYYTSFIDIPTTVIEFYPITIVVGLLFAVVAGVLATLAPALRAAHYQPARAMRGITADKPGKMSLAERVLPPLRHLPIRWKLVVRNFGRNKLRTVSSLIGIALAVVVVFTSVGMVDSVSSLIDRQFEDIQKQDAVLYLAEPYDDAMAKRIADVKGVRRVEPVAELAAVVRTSQRSFSTELLAYEPDTQMHGFLPVGGGSTTLPREGVLLGAAVRDKLKVAVGDTVTVRMPQLDKKSEQKIVGFLDEPVGTFAYISLPALRKTLGQQMGTAAEREAMVLYDADADRSQLRRQLSGLSGVVGYEDSRSMQNTIDQYMGLFWAFIGMMLILGAVMAFALIFNTMTANVQERTAELATLNANGMPRRSLASMVTAENMVLCLVGTIIGLGLGYGVAYQFIQTWNSDMFDFTLDVQPLTYVLTVVAIMLAGLVSQWPVLRAVGRVDIAKVVRERSL
ncbi:MAG: FtsX-like permease family protein [Actinobacteria bacterium]|nr:FtsX-like permease family protein [Actinomycetota bacterium]